jgi:hypothetical protein
MKLYATIAIEVDDEWAKEEPVKDGLDELKLQLGKRLANGPWDSWQRIILGTEFVEWQAEDGEWQCRFR